MARRKTETYPSGFYVYRLVDPRTGLPFYVGKGQRDRAWQHQRDVEAGRPGANLAKIRWIRQIIISGHDVEVEIVGQYELESDALDHEYRLVDATPTLTNIMPGGGGGASTPQLIERRRKEREERLRALREKERVEARARALAERKKAMLEIPGAERHRREIEKWVEAQDADKLASDMNRRETANIPPPSKHGPCYAGAIKVSGGRRFGRRRNKNVDSPIGA